MKRLYVVIEKETDKPFVACQSIEFALKRAKTLEHITGKKYTVKPMLMYRNIKRS